MEKTNSSTGIFFQTTFYIPEEARPQMDWSNYLVVGLLIFITILGIAGSLIPKITQRENLPIKVVKCFSFADNFSKIITVPKTT